MPYLQNLLSANPAKRLKSEDFDPLGFSFTPGYPSASAYAMEEFLRARRRAERLFKRLYFTIAFLLFLVVTLSVVTIVCTLDVFGLKQKFDAHHHSKFDYLLFAVQWPETSCRLHERTGGRCSIDPRVHNNWTIHGIWPTHLHSEGPFFCDKTHFNLTSLGPIESDLEVCWPNIYKGQRLSSLWEHEWKKHGTCCEPLPQMDNELKYFEQGIHWLQGAQTQIKLTLNEIVPSSDKLYSLTDFLHPLETSFGKNLSAQCGFDLESHHAMIHTIFFCFDKNLGPIDCPKQPTCPPGDSKNILYPPFRDV